jgi:hypothetical protein
MWMSSVPGGIDDVLEQRATRDGLQDLGQVRLHALALAGGQDDDGDGHGMQGLLW